MDIVSYLRINHPENRRGIFLRTIFTGAYGHKGFIVTRFLPFISKDLFRRLLILFLNVTF